MLNNSIKLLILDMDGTIFETRNFWMELHKIYGNHNEAYCFFSRNIHLDYSTLFQIMCKKFWTNIDISKYVALTNQIKYNRSVVELVKRTSKLGIISAIVSSGDKTMALRAQRDINIDYIFANTMFTREGRFTGRSLVGVDDKSKDIAVTTLLNELGLSWSNVACIGDSKNDIPVAIKSSISFSYNSDDPILNSCCTYQLDKSFSVSEVINALRFIPVDHKAL